MSSSQYQNGRKNDTVYWIVAIVFLITGFAAPIGFLMIVLKLLGGNKRKRGRHPYYMQQDASYAAPMGARTTAAAAEEDAAAAPKKKKQSKRKKTVDAVAASLILEGYLDALSKSRYGLIARELKAGQEEVRAACELIRSLNPRPGTGFAARENLTYINPDIIVVSFPDHFELLTNDYYFPTLNISGYYTRLLQESDDEQVKEYLTGKVRQAKWMVKAIEQRRSTLMACAQCILELQEDFFRHGPGHLVPLSLADVAGHIGVHESTVSRAVKEKYIQCSMGVYPLSYFFSRSLGAAASSGEEASSPDAAKALLKKLIAEEDKRRPLSDQKLCEQMAAQGCAISRRTVAKYRDELHIPSTAGRRQYE